MKSLKWVCSGVAALLVLAIATPAMAGDDEKGKEQTIKGEAKCAKCLLKEAGKCRTVIQAENKDGKMVTYYLADNEVAKNFHDEVCKEAKKVTATGTVKTVEGKEELTVSKIEVAKD